MYDAYMYIYIKNIFLFAKDVHSMIIHDKICVHMVQSTLKIITQERNADNNRTKLLRKALMSIKHR